MVQFIPDSLGKLQAKRSFCSTEHLHPEAVAAFVDGELSSGAVRRARLHMLQCEECLRDVVAQRRASARVRECNDDSLKAPASLLQKLTKLCAEADSLGPQVAEPSPLELKLRALRKRG